MVELIINGQSINLYQNQQLSYTRRAADFGQVASVASSYTSVFKAPRSLNNVKTFEGLGIAGDTSRTPYQALRGDLVEDGITLIRDGIINVTETNTDYKISIIDGMKDFFNIIRGKAIADIDLSELNHTKSLQSIQDSWDNLTEYKYLVANYGNPYLGFGINSNTLVPSVKLSYLWDKIFAFAGFTYSGNFDLTKDWITYPKPIPQNNFTPTRYFYGKTLYFGFFPINNAYQAWNTQNLTTGTIQNNWQYVVPEIGPYKLAFTADGIINYTIRIGKLIVFTNQQLPYKFRVTNNGQVIGEFQSGADPMDLYFNANQGDIIDFTILPLSSQDLIDYGHITALFDDGKNVKNPSDVAAGPSAITSGIEMEVFKLDQQFVSVSEEFGKLKMEEFFKEILWRFALVPFLDKETRNVHFLTMNERLNADTIDWSKKYIRRTSENYKFKDYGQSNVFAMKYTGEETGYNDGEVLIDNGNLKPQAKILESFTYGPLPGLFELRLNAITGDRQQVWQLPMWEKETKTEDDGTVSIEYKELSDRYYIVKEEQVTGKRVDVYGFDASGQNFIGFSENAFPVASRRGTIYSEIVPQRYSRFESVLNDTRIHEIELALSQIDIANLDMEKLYYFEQEHNRYLLNRVTWKKGQPAKGEFLRVKGDESGPTGSLIETDAPADDELPSV